MMRSLLLVAAVAAPIPAWGQSAEPDSPAASGPPAPASDGFDWLRMRNGEWLKGEIRELQDDRLVFESDEFDVVTVDWDDVAELYSGRTNMMMLRDRSQLEGSFSIADDAVVVDTDDGDVTVPRRELRSIVPGESDREISFWSGKLSLGFTARSGNTDQTDVSGLVQIQRRDARSRFLLDYTGAYSEVDGERTADNHRASGTYDLYVSERLYLRPASLTFYRDPFQNIAYRLTPGAGLGYDILSEGDLDWSVGVGAGWQHTRFDESAPGDEETDDTAVALAETSLEWDATSRLDIGLDFNISTPVPDSDQFQFRTVLWSEIDVVGDLTLDVRFTWDRVNSPEPLADGTTPDPDDYRIYVGVGWDF